jgi:Putative prokaryotic signal transducing protein
MKRIYTAANLPDAHLVRNMLEQAGIPSHIFNANAIGALGDLPMSAAYPQVWISQVHQEQHARAVVAEYNRAAPPAEAKSCGACQESSPGEFELCWNCGGELPVHG